MLEKLSRKRLGILLLGLSLSTLSLGGLYSIQLVRTGLSFAIFNLGIILSTYYIFTSIIYSHEGKTLKKSTKYLGLLGGFLLLFFFGIQSPQLPFKKILLISGIGITLLVILKRPQE